MFLAALLNRYWIATILAMFSVACPFAFQAIRSCIKFVKMTSDPSRFVLMLGRPGFVQKIAEGPNVNLTEQGTIGTGSRCTVIYLETPRVHAEVALRVVALASICGMSKQRRLCSVNQELQVGVRGMAWRVLVIDRRRCCAVYVLALCF